MENDQGLFCDQKIVMENVYKNRQSKNLGDPWLRPGMTFLIDRKWILL